MEEEFTKTKVKEQNEDKSLQERQTMSEYIGKVSNGDSWERKYFKFGDHGNYFYDSNCKLNNKKRMCWSVNGKNKIKELTQFADDADDEKLDPNDYMRVGWSTIGQRMFDSSLFDKEKLLLGIDSHFSKSSEIDSTVNTKPKEPTFIDPILELFENENLSIFLDQSFLEQIEEMQKYHLQSLISLKWMEKCLSSFESFENLQ